MWNKLWVSHQQTKTLLSFAVMNPKAMEYAAKTVEMKEEAKKKGPPSYTNLQKAGLFLGPLLFILFTFIFNFSGLSPEGQAVMGTTIWMAMWWITEAVPIPITSLMPIVLLPMFGAGTEGEIASSYGDSILFLFLGGFLIALAPFPSRSARALSVAGGQRSRLDERAERLAGRLARRDPCLERPRTRSPSPRRGVFRMRKNETTSRGLSAARR